MDNKLKTTISKIVKLAKQNSEFNAELRKALEIAKDTDVVDISKGIKSDVSEIRKALNITASNSITFDFINNQRLQDQLTIDNLRMENAALDMKSKEYERLYAFCINAFYQLENVVNFYFHILYPNINELQDVIEKYTSQEKFNKYIKKNDNRKIKSVTEIPISNKLDAMCNLLGFDLHTKMTCSQLRQVRNAGEHRCSIIIKDKNEEEPLYKFFSKNDFNSIRMLLKQIVSEIKRGIESANRPTKIQATITDILPSACFVRISQTGQKEQIPQTFLAKMRNKNIGEAVTLVVKNRTIIDLLS